MYYSLATLHCATRIVRVASVSIFGFHCILVKYLIMDISIYIGRSIDILCEVRHTQLLLDVLHVHARFYNMFFLAIPSI